MSRKLVLFNGPPRSGKDTAADHIWSKYDGARLIKMSAPIKRAIRAAFDFTPAQVHALEQMKDQQHPLLFDHTYRETQIAFSEEYMKPLFGDNIFGRIAMRDIDQSYSTLFLCSDSGFASELNVIIPQFGPRNVLLIRLHRENCTFNGDSRGYIMAPPVGVTMVDYANNGDLATYKDQIYKVVDAWLNQ